VADTCLLVAIIYFTLLLDLLSLSFKKIMINDIIVLC